MQIESVTLKTPLIAAPLAGYSDLAFRLLCREYGAGLAYSEMISCHGLVHRQRNTLGMTKTAAAERPVAMQLFGSVPEIMGDAAAILSELPIDLIDINMGCPVKKVIKKGAGAALMKEPKLAERIIRAVCGNSKMPVTVKIRSGWDHRHITAVDFAKMAENAGAAAITIHARTWSDGFGGTADWSIIRRVKQAVSIPVLGNGDIKTHQDSLKVMAETGCNGVMIGRAALGAPWVFSPEASASPPLAHRLAALRRHLELIKEFHPAESMLAKIKNQAGKYFRGLHGGGAMRQRIYAAKNLRDLEETVNNLDNR